MESAGFPGGAGLMPYLDVEADDICCSE